MSLPPPRLEQAHVRLAEDYRLLREEYDRIEFALQDFISTWVREKRQLEATIETQQVTIQALTAVLGAMRDNERTLRSEVASLTAELNENAQLLLDAGQEVSRLKAKEEWKARTASDLLREANRPIWEKNIGAPPHKWDLRS